MSPASKTPCSLTAIAVAIGILTACGGVDDTTDGASSAATQLTGVVATGAAAAGATVTVVDSDPATADPPPVTTSSDGTYSIDVTGQKLPLMIRATTAGDLPRDMFALVSELSTDTANVANVTPLTHAIAALIAPASDPAALFNAGALASTVSASTVADATALLVNTLTTDAAIAASLGSGFNPLSTPFAANGSGIDAVLDQLAIEVGSNGVSVANLAAPLLGDGAQQTVRLTPAQARARAPAPTLPASINAADLPSSADLAALGAKFEACMALPVAQRVTVDGSGTVTAVSATCSFSVPDWKSDGRTWAEQLGQFTFAKTQLNQVKVGKGLVVATFAAPNATDPKVLKNPYCNTQTCVIARYELTTPNGLTTSIDWLLGKVNGAWAYVGNQLPYRAFVEPRLSRFVNTNRDGLATGSTTPGYFDTDRFESQLRLSFDPSVGETRQVRAVRITGPGLPAAGVVLVRSQRCGSSDRLSILTQDGSTRTSAGHLFWTSGAAADFILDAARLDGTPLEMPVPSRTATFFSNSNFSPAPVAELPTTIPAWSRYKFEVFRFEPLSEVPDEIFYRRIASAAENAAKGVGKAWPALAPTFIDAYLKPTGAQAGALTSTGHSIGWTAPPGVLVSSAYLFGQNFRTATNAQNETANYAVRGRLDFEPAALGDLSAGGEKFIDRASAASLSSFSANVGSNPNPRCASAEGVVALTSDPNDYREAGLSFRGPDRKRYLAIWNWER